MFEKFKKYKEGYAELSNSFLKKGNLPLGPTEVGYWGSSSMTEVYKLFKKIGLGKYKSFVDLGSGDGRVVAVASLFTKSFGIEGDKELCNIANDMMRKLGFSAEFIYANYDDEDLSVYDVIFIFPDKKDNILNEKLKKMKGILVVYGPNFPLDLHKREIYDIDGTLITIYDNKGKI